MHQASIFAPFFAMLLLTFAVWTYMYVRRLAFIRSREFTPEEMTPAGFAAVSPPAVANPSDNLKNLFEIPVLFYALTLYLTAVDEVDTAHLAAAWVFVAFRALHSAVHCTVNVVVLRFLLYVVSTAALWFMAGRAAARYVGWTG